MSEMMIGILIVFANYERRLISVRTREGLQARKQRGERYCRWAEYGWRWEKRHDPVLGKDVNVKVADEGERAIMAKCVELRAAGQSLDKIRQHLNYEMKARTRLGGHWTTSRVACPGPAGAPIHGRERERNEGTPRLGGRGGRLREHR